MRGVKPLLTFAACCLALAGLRAETTVRVGMFPNVTHAHALVARSFSTEGKGWFEQRLGEGVRIEWYVYNAGPSAMEAVFARSIDFSYVGPSPAVNAYTKARGSTIRVVSGAVRGGEALVVRGDSIKQPADFRGKSIATPQLGNTQDVECRSWLIAQGIEVTLVGGEARVIPTENPDMLSLFQQGKLDAAWTVEPWVSRLVAEAGGRIFFEPKDSVTTILVGREEFLGANSELAGKFVAAHQELTQWIKDNPEEAQKRVRDELTALTRKEIPIELIRSAWPRMNFDSAISVEPFRSFLEQARVAGFLRASGDLSNLIWKPK